MIVKIKDIKEIVPETIDYLLMSKRELVAREERTADLLGIALKEKNKGQEISTELQRSLIAGLQYDTLESAMNELKRKDRKYYSYLKKQLKDKQENAKIDLDYLEKIISFSVIQEMRTCCDSYRTG